MMYLSAHLDPNDRGHRGHPGHPGQHHKFTLHDLHVQNRRILVLGSSYLLLLLCIACCMSFGISPANNTPASSMII